MRKTKHRGIAAAAADFLLNLIAYNLIRIPKLGCSLARPVSSGGPLGPPGVTGSVTGTSNPPAGIQPQLRRFLFCGGRMSGTA